MRCPSSAASPRLSARRCRRAVFADGAHHVVAHGRFLLDAVVLALAGNGRTSVVMCAYTSKCAFSGIDQFADLVDFG